MYVLHALDCKMALGRTTEVGTYSGFIGRPVLGLFLLCFYGPNSHLVLTLDIVNSLVDYINFCVLDCLPEYEDGLEKNLTEVLDDEQVDNEKKKKKRRSRHDLPVYTSKELF
ncbi:hypothetical protein RvY_12450 [Ramazzottius varieornatus]|uniref:Uncharacterized protein n=1 Tax=Ramazzottius varieornatus TaxID=947166 RepID=A0A1D1VLU3_RAMVA|nr:hypothetical protein RvY_12450 [Ramazzottius varieornatus]